MASVQDINHRKTATLGDASQNLDPMACSFYFFITWLSINRDFTLLDPDNPAAAHGMILRVICTVSNNANSAFFKRAGGTTIAAIPPSGNGAWLEFVWINGIGWKVAGAGGDADPVIPH